MSEMILHLTEADNIFRSTDFDGDVVGDNIGFTVAAITVYKDAKAEGELAGLVQIIADVDYTAHIIDTLTNNIVLYQLPDQTSYLCSFYMQ